MKHAWVIYLGLLFVLVRCATLPYEPYAREVKKRPTAGGTIALNTVHRSEDRARADFMMKSNCGTKDVSVVEEGEVVVGEKAEATTDKNAKTTTNTFTIGAFTFGDEKPTERTSTQTTQLKEWHISYHCMASTDSQKPVASRKRK